MGLPSRASPAAAKSLKCDFLRPRESIKHLFLTTLIHFRSRNSQPAGSSNIRPVRSNEFRPQVLMDLGADLMEAKVNRAQRVEQCRENENNNSHNHNHNHNHNRCRNEGSLFRSGPTTRLYTTTASSPAGRSVGVLLEHLDRPRLSEPEKKPARFRLAFFATSGWPPPTAGCSSSAGRLSIWPLGLVDRPRPASDSSPLRPEVMVSESRLIQLIRFLLLAVVVVVIVVVVAAAAAAAAAPSAAKKLGRALTIWLALSSPESAENTSDRSRTARPSELVVGSRMSSLVLALPPPASCGAARSRFEPLDRKFTGGDRHRKRPASDGLCEDDLWPVAICERPPVAA